MNRRDSNPDRTERYALAGRGLSSRGSEGAVPRAHWLPAAMQQPVRRPDAVPAAPSAASVPSATTEPASVDADASQDDWWNDLVDLTAVMVESAEHSGALARMQTAIERDSQRGLPGDVTGGTGADAQPVDAGAGPRMGSGEDGVRSNADAGRRTETRTAPSSPWSSAFDTRGAENPRSGDAGDLGRFSDSFAAAGQGPDASANSAWNTAGSRAIGDVGAKAHTDEARFAARFSGRTSGMTVAGQAGSSIERTLQQRLQTQDSEAQIGDRHTRASAADDTDASDGHNARSRSDSAAAPASSAPASRHRIGIDTAQSSAYSADASPSQVDGMNTGASNTRSDRADRIRDGADSVNRRSVASEANSMPRPSTMRSAEMGLPDIDRSSQRRFSAMTSPPALDAASIAALLAPAPAASGPSVTIDRVQVTVQAPAASRPPAAPGAAAPAARSMQTARGTGGGVGYRSPWASYFTRRD